MMTNTTKRIAKDDRGKADYEAAVAKRPTYHDGTPREKWENLREIARWSWNRAANNVGR